VSRLTLTELRAGLARRLAPAASLDAVGLAVSGGADSLALLLLAAEWARQIATPPKLIVYSVDHGLRPEAAAEAAFVAEIAARLGLAARALRWAGDKPLVGVQAAARTARYRLMGEAMRADGAKLLLTAHHLGDQAETVLMRLAHGSGLEGLRGMDAVAEVEGVPVFRPLLDVAPELLRELVAEAGLVPVSDPSNFDGHYERVRWRQALPQLVALGVTPERLFDFAQRAGDADEALAQWADERFEALVRLDRLGAAQLSHPELARLPRAVATRLLARLLDVAGGGQKPRALGAVERLHARILGENIFTGVTTLGTKVARRGETLWFAREPGRQPIGPATIAPAETLLWDGRFRIANRSPRLAIQVHMAEGFSRARVEQLVGGSVAAPAAAIRSAPLVTRADGAVLAFGCYRLDDDIEVELSRSHNAGNVTAN